MVEAPPFLGVERDADGDLTVALDLDMVSDYGSSRSVAIGPMHLLLVQVMLIGETFGEQLDLDRLNLWLMGWIDRGAWLPELHRAGPLADSRIALQA